jgi:hypothetical protein
MVDFTATQVQAKGGAPTASHEGGGGNQGRCGHAPKCDTAALRQQGARAIPPTSKDPHHRRRATGRVPTAASVTQPLMWSTPGLVGKGPPWSPMR